MPPLDLTQLRARLTALAPPSRHGVLALDGGAVDAALGGGLALGALHAVEGAGVEIETAAAPAAFLAGLLARMPVGKPAFWISATPDLYAPGLIGCGFDPARLIQLHCLDATEALAAMERLLRSAAAQAVVAEIGGVGRLAGRRVQMACLGSGTSGFLLRRWPHGRRAAEEITAAVTRWRIGPAPSLRNGRAPGRPRLRVALLHTRLGAADAWILEQEDRDDTPHPFRVVAGLADPQAAPRRLAG